MNPTDIVITGMGLITPLGQGVPENWQGLAALRTGIGHYPAEDLPLHYQYLGKINSFQMPEDFPPKLLSQAKFLNRGSTLGFTAAREALAHARFNSAEVPPERRALYIASGDYTMVGSEFLYPATKEAALGRWESFDPGKLNRAALDKVNPFFLLESLNNNLFSFLSAVFEFMGSNTSMASLSPGGICALELACRSLRLGMADVALAVGCGSWIAEIARYELDGLGLLSRCRRGTGSYRPLDRKRDGFLPGEGGAAVVLERQVHAQRRGAPVLGVIKGCGNQIEFSGAQGLSVPTAVTAPVLRQTLAASAMSLDEISFINPHGSGTRKGDRSELRSIVNFLGHHAGDVPLCAMKSYTGHLGAASDLAEVVLGIEALRHNLAPATLNFESADAEFAGLRISAQHRPCEQRSFLSVSYGICGQSAGVMVTLD